MTTHPILGEIASAESLGRAVAAMLAGGCNLSVPQLLADINARALQEDPNATGSLCQLDPDCGLKLPCPHHVGHSALAALIAAELARIDGYDPKDPHGGLYDLRWSGGPNPEPEGDAWHMDYLPKGERIAAAILRASTTATGGVG